MFTDNRLRNLVQLCYYLRHASVQSGRLGKVTQLLNDAGLMTSLKGPNGGVGLAKPADQVFLIDVIQATDGLGVFEECILGLPECKKDDPCSFHSTWERSREGLLRELEKESLASIFRRRRRKESGQ